MTKHRFNHPVGSPLHPGVRTYDLKKQQPQHEPGGHKPQNAEGTGERQQREQIKPKVDCLDHSESHQVCRVEKLELAVRASLSSRESTVAPLYAELHYLESCTKFSFRVRAESFLVFTLSLNIIIYLAKVGSILDHSVTH